MGGGQSTLFDSQHFDRLLQRVLSYLRGRNLYLQDCYLGVDPRYQIPIRVLTEDAWHSLFAHQLFIRPNSADLSRIFIPEFTVINAPGYQAEPEQDGTRSEAFIILNLERKIVLIGGTSYAGEIKKSMFTVMNYLLPKRK